MMVLLATDSHPPDHQRRSGDRSSKLQVGAHVLDVREHALQGRRNGDLGYRIRELAVLNPQAGGAARIVARDNVYSGADQFRDVQPLPDAAHYLIRRTLSLFEK